MQRGFSLVELSIVLVILGLLVGGILGGQSLIKAAQLRKYTVDYSQYETAINAFKVKYDCLPGDCSNANYLFGGTTCSARTVSPNTCNGNGDGYIKPYETRYVCQQLSQSGIIPSACVGGFGNGPDGVQAGINALASSYGTNNLIEISYRDAAGWSVYMTHFKAANYLNLAINSAAGSYYPAEFATQGMMTVEDAEIVDRKIDDGKPGTGKFLQTSYGCGDIVTNSYAASPATNNYCLNFYRLAL